jgi:hypothetical protein
MPQVGFEPTIPVFEWAKTVHALDRATTVIGKFSSYLTENTTRLCCKEARLILFRKLVAVYYENHKIYL